MYNHTQIWVYVYGVQVCLEEDTPNIYPGKKESRQEWRMIIEDLAFSEMPRKLKCVFMITDLI